MDLAPEAVPVFERLRAWRAATAKEQGVPAYVVFHDATLRQIAGKAPSTLAELGKVSGVGENKLAKYGQQILDTWRPAELPLWTVIEDHYDSLTDYPPIADISGRYSVRVALASP